MAFPTRCLYGLGADALDADAVDRIYDIKQRRRRKPILILIHDREGVARFVRSIPESGRLLMDRFWPGRLTLVFEAASKIPDSLTGGAGKIGIRLCGHPVARALIKAIDGPITGTSANLSGHDGCDTVDAFPPRILEEADLILDAGRLSGGVGSTVVDITQDPPKILREGIIPSEDIFAAVGHPARNCVDKRV